MRFLQLIGFVIICWAAAAGWWLYDRGLSAPDILRAHIHPIVIADEATTYSPSQLEQMRDTSPDMRHDYGLDKTFAPAHITYVRVEYLASRVDKPFPKIYVADAAFPYNKWTLESVLVTKPEAMQQVMSRAESLPCAPDSGNARAGTDRFEILIRPANQHLERCLVSKTTGCSFLDAERRLTEVNAVGDAEYPLSEMEELRSRVDCPKLPALSWK